MHRRELLTMGALAGAATGLSWFPRATQAQAPALPRSGTGPDDRAAGDAAKPAKAFPRADAAKLKITDIRAILTAPAGIRLVVVKVLTNEPGLYGLGCATFTQRARVVETAVDKYLRPFL